MPDAALEDTELQFFALLDDASGDLPIYLKLYSLTGIPRAGCRPDNSRAVACLFCGGRGRCNVALMPPDGLTANDSPVLEIDPGKRQTEIIIDERYKPSKNKEL
jgi:hypothetical protein